jgi:hypothetical protein
MAAKRLYAPSIMIDSVEYKCKARSVSLEPGSDKINFCEYEWTFGAEIEIGYGDTESYTLLAALEDTVVDVVLKPADDAVADGNPAASFQIYMPPVPFMTTAGIGERMTFPMSVVTEAPPVVAVV